MSRGWGLRRRLGLCIWGWWDEFCGVRNTEILSLRLRMAMHNRGGGFLVAEFAVEGGVGELAGVEDLSGALGIDGVPGEALGDFGGDLEDGIAVAERRDGETAVGVEVDGRGADAVGGAEVLAADGGFGAAGVVGDVLEALVELGWALDVGLGFVHGGYPLPGFGADCGKVGRKRKGPAGAGPALFVLLS